jgi:hypothetical protein
MFLQDITPDTSAYMIAGYAIFFVLLIIYLASLYIRSRNLNQDLTVLESMREPSPAPAGKVKAAESGPARSASHVAPAPKRKKAPTKTGKTGQVKKKVAGKK